MCFVCMHVYVPCACRCPWGPEDGITSPGTAVTGDCEPSCGSCELDPGPLQEQLLLAARQYLQPLGCIFIYFFFSSYIWVSRCCPANSYVLKQRYFKEVVLSCLYKVSSLTQQMPSPLSHFIGPVSVQLPPDSSVDKFINKIQFLD